jgi:hypothetical protein
VRSKEKIGLGRWQRAAGWGLLGCFLGGGVGALFFCLLAQGRWARARIPRPHRHLPTPPSVFDLGRVCNRFDLDDRVDVVVAAFYSHNPLKTAMLPLLLMLLLLSCRHQPLRLGAPQRRQLCNGRPPARRRRPPPAASPAASAASSPRAAPSAHPDAAHSPRPSAAACQGSTPGNGPSPLQSRPPAAPPPSPAAAPSSRAPRSTGVHDVGQPQAPALLALVDPDAVARDDAAAVEQSAARAPRHVAALAAAAPKRRRQSAGGGSGGRGGLVGDGAEGAARARGARASGGRVAAGGGGARRAGLDSGVVIVVVEEVAAEPYSVTRNATRMPLLCGGARF